MFGSVHTSARPYVWTRQDHTLLPGNHERCQQTTLCGRDQEERYGQLEIKLEDWGLHGADDDLATRVWTVQSEVCQAQKARLATGVAADKRIKLGRTAVVGAKFDDLQIWGALLI